MSKEVGNNRMGFLKDTYIMDLPSSQNILDLFENEWSTKMPKDCGLESKPGTADLTSDSRIHWMSEQLGGLENLQILELGPLEAAHTIMMHDEGAKSITCIEANVRSYLKCLCIKEIFNLDRASFLLGDATKYLMSLDDNLTFDIAVASGILYHMPQPIDFLLNLRRNSDAIYIWTHYYDERLISDLDLLHKFLSPIDRETPFGTYQLYKYDYGRALDWSGFCGGHADHSYWMKKDDIVSILNKAGFDDISLAHDHRDHPNGPAISIFAKKTS